jgi:hypothetical protein
MNSQAKIFADIYDNSMLFFMALVRTSTSRSPLTNSHHVYNEVSDLWPEELLKLFSEILKIETKINTLASPINRNFLLNGYFLHMALINRLCNLY